MEGASVPETTVYKDKDPGSPKDHVGTPRQTSNNSIPQTKSMKGAPQQQFEARVCTADAAHRSAARC
jgi:hypothetical protein